jgi:hypothetical protein
MELFTESPTLIGLSIISTVVGTLALVIRQIVAAQANKIRAESKTMIEEAQRKSQNDSDETKLTLIRLEAERDAQQAKDALTDRLLDQLAQSQNVQVEMLKQMAGREEYAHKVIDANNAELEKAGAVAAQHTTVLEGLIVSVDKMQEAILALPAALEEQNTVHNMLQSRDIDTMVTAVTTLKAAMETFIQNQSPPKPRNGKSSHLPAADPDAMKRWVVIKEAAKSAAKEAKDHEEESIDPSDPVPVGDGDPRVGAVAGVADGDLGAGSRSPGDGSGAGGS